MNDLEAQPRTIIMVSREGHCLTDLLTPADAGRPLTSSRSSAASRFAPVAELRWRPLPQHSRLKDAKAQAEPAPLASSPPKTLTIVPGALHANPLRRGLLPLIPQGRRVIDIHHSFLPSSRAHARAGPCGVKLIGAGLTTTVFADLDEGPIISRTSSSPADSRRTWWRWPGRGAPRLAQAVRFHAGVVLMNGNRTVSSRAEAARGRTKAGARSAHAG